MSSLIRLITTSSIDGSAGDKAQVALDAALQVDDKEFLQLLMAEVADNNALLKQFNGKIESYRNIIELLDSSD
jgi:hypothetical protein